MNQIFLNLSENKRIFLAMAFLFCFHLYTMTTCNIFYFTPDEMGYWANAAAYIGMDWSALKNPLYYNGGYSFIIAVFMYFFDSPLFIYRSLMILNALFNCVSFYFLYEILVSKYVFTSNHRQQAFIFALLSMAYPAYTLYTETTQPECLLMMLGILSFYLLIAILEKGSRRYYILEALILGYMFAVHTRSVPIIVSVMGALLLNAGWVWRQKKTIDYNLMLFLGLIGVLFAGNLYLKYYLLDSVYLYLGQGGNLLNGGNLLSGNLYKLKALLSAKGILEFLRILEGHLYYIVVSTFGFSILGMIYSWCEFFRNKEDFKKKIFYFTTSAAAVLSLLMSVLYFTNSNEQGLVFATFSRYFEASMGAVMVSFGLVAVIDCLHNKKTRLLLSSFVVTVYIILLFQNVIQYYQGVDGIRNYQVGFLFFKVGNTYSYYYSSLFIVTGLLILITVRKSDNVLTVSYVLLGTMFLVGNFLNTVNGSVRNMRYDTMMKVSQGVVENLSPDEHTVYFYSPDHDINRLDYWWVAPIDLQYLLLKNVTVNVLRKSNELTADLKGKLIITTNGEDMIKKMNYLNSSSLSVYKDFIIWKMNE
ncbi:glycosyltransferase family 39 protein [Acidaminococcus fermentans]|uniref:Glycosyltransferase family 39 protein n=1 Tax=Acidaminococcus fermentans TaxID=905 RepID=A0A6N7VQA2_ACIFE|nr:glycosyltransferase family 39 protein [Acidaminococcus fermentans]MSS83150.1 glycosyltransferase family 39 protein [Acidaminococcus fermentans]